jgi:FixJ family two-component response regulator
VPYLNGKDFIDRYKPAEEECIILDVAMPEMNGNELFYYLNAKGFQTAVIFLSACGDIPMAVKAVKYGAIDFITKPFDVDELIKAVQEAINKTKQMKTLYKEVQKFEVKFKRLTPKEKKTFFLMLQKKSISNTADLFKRSKSTIEKHRMSVLKKLEFANTDKMIQYCEEHSISYPDV